MSDAEKLAQFMDNSAGATGFGDPAKATEFALKEPHSPHCTATETWWYQFYIPELQLNGEIYFWIHTNLRTMSGGVWMFKGIKQHYLQAEHFNWKNHMPYPEITGDTMTSAELGLSIKIIDPLKRQEITYDDKASGTHLRLEANATFGPICRTSNMHFDQPTHITGILRLNGQDLKIDCYGSRDRSWGEPRFEDAMVHPSITWCMAHAVDGKSGFLFNGVDDPATDPVVASFNLPKEALFKGGWYFRDGELRNVVSMTRRTHRAADNMQPLRIECDFADSAGDKHHVTGKIIASLMWSPWPNLSAYFGSLVEWTLDGSTRCYGDAQEMFWAEAIKRRLAGAA